MSPDPGSVCGALLGVRAESLSRGGECGSPRRPVPLVTLGGGRYPGSRHRALWTRGLQGGDHPAKQQTPKPPSPGSRELGFWAT